MYALAFSFFAVAKIQSIVFDKTLQQLQFWKTSIYCVKRVQRFPMDTIVDIRAVKQGHFGANINTLSYKVVAIFRDPTAESVTIIETAKEDKCRKQVRLMVFELV